MVVVGEPAQATLLAGGARATITLPSASGGSGTLQLTGTAALSSAPAGPPMAPGLPPASPIAAVAITPSATATYGTLPTFTFALPVGTQVANASFTLYLDDPATGIGLLDLCAYVATSTSSGIVLTAATSPCFPDVASAPPVLPITFSASNMVGFALYETSGSN